MAGRGIPGEMDCAVCWEEDCGGCAVLSPAAGVCPLCGRAVERNSFHGWYGGRPCHWACLEAEEDPETKERSSTNEPGEEGVVLEQTSQRREKRKYPGRRPPAPRPGGQKEQTLRRRRGDMAPLSALAREARRRRMTYGELCRTLTEEEREQVILAWRAEHPEPSGDGGGCEGCVYWKDGSATAPELGKLCHFALERGRMRRRDGGRCLEYRREEHGTDA